MKTMVSFHAGGGAYAIPVESTTSVRAAKDLVTVAGCDSDVVGVLAGEPPITVVSFLGSGQDLIVVLTVDDRSFGLLVQDVVGVVRVEDADIGPPPSGLNLAHITGTVRNTAELVLIVDARVLVGRL
jgi:chemotaxis signal transduction protein